MILHLIIEDFAKIKRADISLSDLIVFVGNNNSGKTLAMQLLYGLRKTLWDYNVTALGAKRSEINGQTLIRCDGEWFRNVEVDVNRHLAENKLNIIKEIFGKSMPIGKICFHLEFDENEFYVSSTLISQLGQEENVVVDIDSIFYYEGNAVRKFSRSIVLKHENEENIGVVRTIWRDLLCKNLSSNQSQLFLPASRSGLQLLYRYYFVNVEESNLVTPMEDFLQFLQLYTANAHLDDARQKLVTFGEDRLIGGKIQQKGEETFYIDKKENVPIPLYLASSMIHELTPFLKALSASKQIDCLYCDEVENSLHPLLQREMARWIIRMVNAGMQVVVSSHSDTMASRLNNLLMLTYKNSKKNIRELLTELNLKENDILRQGLTVSAYEFKVKNEDKTVVEKLEFLNYPLIPVC